MKYVFLMFIIFAPIAGYSQTLELNISTPQPRLGENFSISANIDTVAKYVFGGLSNKFTVSTYTTASNETSKIGISLIAKKPGRNEVGPLALTINGKKYMTNKLKFDVVDSLPYVNKGLWIRQVHVDDTTSYIIIEQRIPSLKYITHPNPSSINLSYKTKDDEKKTEMVQDSVVNFHGSVEDTKSFKDSKSGEELYYQNEFATYEVKHEKNKNLILTSDYFTHLPNYYKFEDIVVK